MAFCIINCFLLCVSTVATSTIYSWHLPILCLPREIIYCYPLWFVVCNWIFLVELRKLLPAIRWFTELLERLYEHTLGWGSKKNAQFPKSHSFFMTKDLTISSWHFLGKVVTEPDAVATICMHKRKASHPFSTLRTNTHKDVTCAVIQGPMLGRGPRLEFSALCLPSWKFNNLSWNLCFIKWNPVGQWSLLPELEASALSLCHFMTSSWPTCRLHPGTSGLYFAAAQRPLPPWPRWPGRGEQGLGLARIRRMRPAHLWAGPGEPSRVLAPGREQHLVVRRQGQASLPPFRCLARLAWR